MSSGWGMSDQTLEPFEWVEIDQDFCTHAYGTAPCEASLDSGGTECFNTRASCQDPANFERGTLTLRFCKNQAFLPEDAYYIPSLVKARTDAGSINPIGASSSSSALGVRGGLTVEFQDHPHTDKLVDPYLASRRLREPSYIATERGTFWTKWRARNAYYVGREIRYKTGFIDWATRQVVNVVTRTYFITGFEGPSADGRVSIQARDLLSRVSNEKAKAPFASTGKLLNDITAEQTTIQLNPVGIGDAEYDLAGLIRIGSELCAYTREPGSDEMDIVRERHNTKKAAAKAGDVVQKCLVFEGVTPTYLLNLFLGTYAGIPAGYLDTGQWEQERTDYMPRLYSGIVASPTGVLDLLAELCQQMYFYLVWDERTAKLKIRAIRPAEGEAVKELDDFSSLVEDSVTLKDMNEQLITQVWVFYGLLNPVASLTDDANYAVREIIATDEGVPEKQGLEKIKKIYCRWIPSTNGAAALDLGQKILARYRMPPRQAVFMLGEKDSSLWLGDFVRLNHRLSVDMTGSPRALNLQVISAAQDKAGALFHYVAQEYVHEQPSNPNERLITIAADQVNVNLRELHDLQYDAPVGGEIINAVLRSGAFIGGRASEARETYMGELKRTQGEAHTYIDALLVPLALRDAVAEAFYARDTANILGHAGYGLRSDMWVVPTADSFDTGEWPAGVTLNLLVEPGAYILGEGGYCGIHMGTAANRDVVCFASDGGNALRVRYPINITNLGTISPGGAGGSPAPIYTKLTNVDGYWWTAIPGGSGAGYRNNIALPNAWAFATSSGVMTVRWTNTRVASAGSNLDGGYGAIVSTLIRFSVAGVNENYSQTVTAGEGADLAGASVLYTSTGSGSHGNGTPARAKTLHGGRPGYAVSAGANLITWINKGDVRGAELA